MPRVKTPTPIRKLAGNPSKRPFPTNEPIYSKASLKPPQWLSKGAITLWNSYAIQLDNNGMLNEANREFLAAYCQLTAAFIAEQEAGEVIDIKKLQQMRLMAREFGFTPSSQAGVNGIPTVEHDEKDRLFN